MTLIYALGIGPLANFTFGRKPRDRTWRRIAATEGGVLPAPPCQPRRRLGALIIEMGAPTKHEKEKALVLLAESRRRSQRRSEPRTNHPFEIFYVAAQYPKSVLQPGWYTPVRNGQKILSNASKTP